MKHERVHEMQSKSFIQSTSFQVGSYFVGIFLYVLTFFARNDSSIIALTLGSIFFTGYMVIYEGVEDTIKQTLNRRKFHPNVHLLMTLGALGALFIGEYREAALLILIFSGAHLLEEYAEEKSSKEISNLLNLHPTKARRLRMDGTTDIVDVQELQIDDQVLVLNGDQVPTDGIVISGRSTIDQSSITGESMPVDVQEGSHVFGSTINGSGNFVLQVTKDSQDTVFAKIVELVTDAQQNVSTTATFIRRLSPIYVTLVLILAPLFYLFGLYIMNWGLQVSFYRTMVFLIGTSPCALAVADIPATLSSISNLARQGVLFKGGSYVSNFADIKAIAFDKTGTLTQGQPVVTDFGYVEEFNDVRKDQLKQILVAMESKSNHPLALAIMNYFPKDNGLELEITNKIGEGLESTYNNKVYKVGKPSLFVETSPRTQEIRERLETQGKTVIFFGEDEQIMMILAIQDVPSPTSFETIQYFKQEHIPTVMITGDAQVTGEAIAQELGIHSVLANVLPAQKSEVINELKQQYGLVAMIGDGVNDAPALVASDIGIAMGTGTDIAIDVADGVLMKHDLTRLIYTHKVSKKLRKIVFQNIVFSMAVVLFLIIVNIFGTINMTLAVTIHEGSTILVLLNGLRMLKNLK